MSEKQFRRRAPEEPENAKPDAEEAAELKALEELINKSPAHAHALLISANLRMAAALEDIADILDERFSPKTDVK